MPHKEVFAEARSFAAPEMHAMPGVMYSRRRQASGATAGYRRS
jgi:hypothetical protein